MDPLPDHYAVLGLQPDASAEDIKQAFRQAALRLHPDRLPGRSTHSSSLSAGDSPPHGPAAAQFLQVQAAWAALGDPASRGNYDRQRTLRALRQAVHIHDHVALLDMEPVADVGGSGQAGFSWPCRCGGAFLLLAADLSSAAAEVAVPCCTCSLHICVVTAGESEPN